MEGESLFYFKCGTKLQAVDVADWLQCENWPDDLRLLLKEAFGDFSGWPSIVFQAEVIGRRVFVDATGSSALGNPSSRLILTRRSITENLTAERFCFVVARNPNS